MSNGILVFSGLSEAKRAQIARIAAGLRQVDVAGLALCTSHDVSAYERGIHVSPVVRSRILSALGFDGMVAS